MHICLYCVRVKTYIILGRYLSNIINRLYCANLIVCKHHRDHTSLLTDRILQLIQRDHPFLIYRQICHPHSLFLQILTSMKYGMMLDLSSNNMPSRMKVCHSVKRPVITLRTSRRKINFLRLCSKTVCDRSSYLFNRFLACLPIFIMS